jgi:hypothetical protein
VSRVEGHRSRVIGRVSRVIGRVSRVIGRGSRVKGRGSKVEGQKSRSRVKSRGSKVENNKFLCILKVLQPLNSAKQLFSLSKLKNFAYVWLCRMAMPYMAMPYGYVLCIIESFACGTKSLMRDLMFESIHLLFYIGV